MTQRHFHITLDEERPGEYQATASEIRVPDNQSIFVTLKRSMGVIGSNPFTCSIDAVSEVLPDPKGSRPFLRVDENDL